MVIHNTIDGFEFVAIDYPFNIKDALKVKTLTKTVDEYINCIIDNHIEKAHIVMPDLEIIKKCPNLKYLKISPSFNAPPDFDFSPLYEAPEIISLHCLNIYGNKKQYISDIHYDKINGLTALSVHANRGALGFNRIETLKSLRVGEFTGENRDISDLFCSKELDTLELNGCKVLSLKGIEKATKLQCLYLYNNRSLQDISALISVRNTLRTLRIENCSKIKDFSILGELENLNLLELTGSNELPDLYFVRSMKNLKTLTFSVNIKNGDLSPCLDLSYVFSEKNRKHYNINDSQLPKKQYVRGNEAIEEWRRLE